MTAADLTARADRVRQIVASVGGNVLAHNGDAMRIEVPADNAPGLMALWGMGGFIPIYREQQFRCGIESRAFYIYDVALEPNAAGTPAPGPAAITAPTPPFAG
jgi:hypothetical protein